jgi:hypothetical protein
MRLGGPSAGLEALQARKILAHVGVGSTTRSAVAEPQAPHVFTFGVWVLLNLDSFFYATTSSTITTLGRARFAVLCIWQLSSHFLIVLSYLQRFLWIYSLTLIHTSSHAVVCWLLFVKLAYAIRNLCPAELHTLEQDLILYCLSYRRSRFLYWKKRWEFYYYFR